MARTANTDKEASANQYAVVAPVPHCAYASLGPDTKVGDRDMGDTSFDVNGAIYSWFDRWLKGDTKAFPAKTPRVRYYMMGANRWQEADQWPPKNVQTMRLYLRSAGHANTLHGDGRLALGAAPATESADRYRYDPMNPVQTIAAAIAATVASWCRARSTSARSKRAATCWSTPATRCRKRSTWPASSTPC